MIYWLRIRRCARMARPDAAVIPSIPAGSCPRDLAHFRIGNVLGLAERLVGGGQNHVLQQLRVGRIERLRINLDGRDGAVALGDHLDRAAAAGGFDRARGELRLDLFPSAAACAQPVSSVFRCWT